ncbi:PEP-CTERM-box response regulator transcription factor [Salinisphaera sp. Q1T1-3]|uniref:PEP-CTERM-box response regulator transcription factor n=1 Tax=Salinisphaera sp. Q1T1-3 TaxID=2321229 RepID=UPI000E7620D2|nr:PEP-CTERM-box response regulator transcription factor [Salinisphaera sp. Q1T1-3]RJS94712.1 PEP-CTERM-box response regulator transcription factor [Salinisphaera sp. Q1T1-3]
MTDNAQRLLIVEDDPGLTRQLRWAFDDYSPIFAEDRAGAVDQLRRHEPQVVLLDLGLPPAADGITEGMAALDEILALAPMTKVIVVTGNGDESSAMQAIATGAYDFYQKPVDTEIVGLIIQRAFHIWQLEQQNRELRSGVDRPLDGVVAISDNMRQVLRQLEKIAPTNATTLLQGDTGTGKEVLARALHRLSPRANRSFVAINCAAIPEHLLESELFGYEKGAFTGAQKQTPGKVELADGGTLFLDEIGDMAPPLQAKLLRFLQERVIERVGGRREIAVDARVICATHRDLNTLIASGTFREDLYYRIAEITLHIPALKDRPGDAVAIARVLFENASGAHKRALRGLAPDAVAAIEAYEWPGNVRELEHRINRGVILTENNRLSAADLGLSAPAGDGRTPERLNLRQVRDEAEREAVSQSLEHAEGNVSHAARLLGISRPALYDLMRKHRIESHAAQSASS